MVLYIEILFIQEMKGLGDIESYYILALKIALWHYIHLADCKSVLADLCPSV